MILAATVFYLACFAGSAWPGVFRIIKRGTSDDLSPWREVALLSGIVGQVYVMISTGALWQVWISPLMTAAAVLAMLVVILKYRKRGTR